MAQFPKLYITDLHFDSVKDVFASAVCVKKCPQEGEDIEFAPTEKVPATADKKAKYNTKPLLNYCFPASIETLPENFKEGWAAAK